MTLALRRRVLRAALLCVSFALCVFGASVILVDVMFPADAIIGGGLALAWPFVAGGVVVVAIGAVGSHEYSRGRAVGFGVLAVIAGCAVSMTVAALSTPPSGGLLGLYFGLLEAVVIFAIAVVPVSLGAVFARWLERRACGASRHAPRPV
jgi:O-antigen/teichoic acid export membrane protein